MFSSIMNSRIKEQEGDAKGTETPQLKGVYFLHWNVTIVKQSAEKKA